jgi:tRNA pseudouridine38-40 synthase
MGASLMSLVRWKLTIEYQGTGYAGWQRQEDGILSIQQEIEDAIRKFCGQDCRLHVAGRTDAGVHAHGQIAHFDLDYGDRPLDGYSLTKAINAHLGTRKITILGAVNVTEDFHARFNAKNKLYIYRILSRLAPPTFDQNLVWWMRNDLDISKMREGAKYLLGQHDFTSFRAAECQAKSPIKTLDRLDIEESPLSCGGFEIRFLVEAKSFLHHQVRNMVGSLVQVGMNKWQPIDMKIVLDAKDRKQGGITAPADGLSLVRVDY